MTGEKISRKQIKVVQRTAIKFHFEHMPAYLFTPRSYEAGRHSLGSTLSTKV